MKKISKAISVVALFMVFIMVAAGCSPGSSNTSAAPPANTPATSEPAASEPAANSDDTAYAPEVATNTPAEFELAADYDGSRYSNDTTSDSAYEREPMTDEEYLAFSENADRDVSVNPLLTFSLKIDTASYRNIARYITSSNLPPSDAVRIEEMINYFNYDESLPENDDTPFSIYTEIGPSPFNANKEIAFVRVKSKDIDRTSLPASNLTFLIDTSGSMDSYDKLPLLQTSFGLLVENLTEDDTVSIVTYAGSAGVVLDSARGSEKDKILRAIDRLSAGGSTAGADGINTAYKLAEKNFSPNANNRVILATDGDFNVGVSSVNELERLIASKRSSGIYMTILGFGTGNIKDNKMETLAKNGNGNYSYIDSAATAKKVLVDELSANLYTIADDVKAQIEFNPARVSSYRLIGYENRMLADRDFNDDTKDAGEIGIGTDVVLMFEITSAHEISLKYQQDDEPAPAGDYADELFEVKIRYKDPGQSVSKLISHPVKAERYSDFNSSDFNFAVSVAAFGHLLKDSPYKGDITAERVLNMAADSTGYDKGGYRKEFIDIVNMYISLTGR